MQASAVAYVVSVSKEKSLEAHPLLLARVQKMKWTETELRECYRYIRDLAPILVHINLDKVIINTCIILPIFFPWTSSLVFLCVLIVSLLSRILSICFATHHSLILLRSSYC